MTPTENLALLGSSIQVRRAQRLPSAISIRMRHMQLLALLAVLCAALAPHRADAGLKSCSEKKVYVLDLSAIAGDADHSSCNQDSWSYQVRRSRRLAAFAQDCMAGDDFMMQLSHRHVFK